MPNLEKDQMPQDANSNANTTNIPAPELQFDLRCDDPEHARAAINALIEKIGNLVIANGSVLRPFSFTEQLYDPNAPEFQNVKLGLTALGFRTYGLGVSLTDGALCIEGMNEGKCPSSAYDGEIKLSIKYWIAQKVDTKPLFDAELPVGNVATARAYIESTIELEPLKLVVNPDPKTLWKDLPTPQDAPYQKPNSDKFAQKLCDGVCVLAASQRGRSHANEGKFRDDHFLVEMGDNANGWSIFAVADGAGSAQYSREGSKIACETVINKLSEFCREYAVSLDEKVIAEFEAKTDWKSNPICETSALEQTNFFQFIYRAVYDAYGAIAQEAKNRQVKIKDFSTTLLCAAMKHYPATETREAFWAIATYWLGDGGMGIYRPNGCADFVALGMPDGGEFAGQTRFLTMGEEITPEKCLARMRLSFVEGFRAVALMTDGLTDPFFPAENDFTSYDVWETFWNNILQKEFSGVDNVEEPVEKRGDCLLKGLDFFVPGNHDDRTILFVLNDVCPITSKKLADFAPVTPQEESAVEVSEQSALEETPTQEAVETPKPAESQESVETSELAESQESVEASESIELQESVETPEPVEPQENVETSEPVESQEATSVVELSEPAPEIELTDQGEVEADDDSVLPPEVCETQENKATEPCASSDDRIVDDETDFELSSESIVLDNTTESAETSTAKEETPAAGSEDVPESSEDSNLLKDVEGSSVDAS